MSEVLATYFDAITLEILWTRLISIVDEAGAAFGRTSFSTVVREANDYACGLMSPAGIGLAENSVAIPGFVGAMPMATQHFLRRFPIDVWQPGDSVITNDPWLGSGHLPDIVMASPIFYRGRIVAFATSIAHAPDIGGSIWSIEAREVFEEGIRLPIGHFFQAGKVNEQLVDFVRANVRVPDQVLGDLHAARSSAKVCADKVCELLEEQGLDEVTSLGEALQARAEGAMRRAITQVPDGEYTHAVPMDGFGAPLTVSVQIRVHADEIDVDYAGTSPQVARGINCPYVNTFAHTTYAIKCMLDPRTPRNDGSYRPIRVGAPEGTIVNPRFPAPVAARQIVVLYLNAAIFGALANVLPDRILAQSGTPHLQMVYAGADRRARPYVLIPFDAAGMGARATKDGLSATPFPTNAGATSVEIMENIAPLLFHQKAFAQNSGGPGQYRGGLGQEIIVEMLSDLPTTISVIADRIDHPADGVLGGLPGTPARIHLQDGRPVNPKGRTQLQRGDTLVIRSAGGGGYGAPALRDQVLVERDLRFGLVSGDAAAGVYPSQVARLRANQPCR
jgi:N-methylhydantoinase B